MEHIAATITLSRRCKSLGRIDTELADQQGRIKVVQRGHFPRPPPRYKRGNGGIFPGPPPLQEGLRDEVYLFQIKYSFEKYLGFRNDTRIQLYIIFLRCVKYEGPPTASDFSTTTRRFLDNSRSTGR